MENFTNTLLTKMGEGDFVAVLAILIVSLIFNLRTILNFLDDRKKVKLANIKDAIANENIDDKTKEFFKEELLLEHFRLVKGFSLEKNLRGAVLSLHENAKGSLGFVHFKRAIEHLRMVDGELSVNITCLHKFAFVYNAAVSIFFALCTITLFLLPIFIDDITLLGMIKHYALAVGSFLLAAFFVFQIRSVISARYIQQEIQKQTQSSNAD